jgi:hypothetical protein
MSFGKSRIVEHATKGDTSTVPPGTGGGTPPPPPLPKTFKELEDLIHSIVEQRVIKAFVTKRKDNAPAPKKKG